MSSMSSLTHEASAHAPLGGVQAVLFDVDNTLLPRPKSILVALLVFTRLYALIPRLRRYCSLDRSTAQVLDTLRQAAIPVGIVTNGSRRKRDLLCALGLDARMSCIFISSEAGARKPSPQMFLQAAGCLGRAPQQIAYVGDEARADMQGAHDVGLKTAWMRRRRHLVKRVASPPADALLESLAALPAALGLSEAGTRRAE